MFGTSLYFGHIYQKFFATQLSDGLFNYFWHQNVKDRKAKTLFFAIYDPQMDLVIMLQWQKN